MSTDAQQLWDELAEPWRVVFEQAWTGWRASRPALTDLAFELIADGTFQAVAANDGTVADALDSILPRLAAG